MKKIISITIIAFILLLFTALSALAGNPPGMIVRDDGQSEDTPWGDLSAVEPMRSETDSEQAKDDIETVIYNDIATIISIISPATTVLVIDIIISAEEEQ